MNIRYLVGLTWVALTPSAHATDAVSTHSAADIRWLSWQVQAKPEASTWCCFTWERNKAKASVCDLDAQHSGFGSDSANPIARSNVVQIYAKQIEDKIVDLRVYGGSCRVQTQGQLTQLGLISPTNSLQRLQRMQTDDSVDSDRLLAAVGAHSDTAALTLLTQYARAEDTERRRKALFWIAQLHGAPGRDVILHAIANDPSASVRKHAVFVLSLLPEPLATESLLTLLKQASQSREIRREALFWLSQMDSEAAQSFFNDLL